MNVKTTVTPIQRRILMTNYITTHYREPILRLCEAMPTSCADVHIELKNKDRAPILCLDANGMVVEVEQVALGLDKPHDAIMAVLPPDARFVAPVRFIAYLLRTYLMTTNAKIKLRFVPPVSISVLKDSVSTGLLFSDRIQVSWCNEPTGDKKRAKSMVLGNYDTSPLYLDFRIDNVDSAFFDIMLTPFLCAEEMRQRNEPQVECAEEQTQADDIVRRIMPSDWKNPEYGLPIAALACRLGLPKVVSYASLMDKALTAVAHIGVDGVVKDIECVNIDFMPKWRNAPIGTVSPESFLAYLIRSYLQTERCQCLRLYFAVPVTKLAVHAFEKAMSESIAFTTEYQYFPTTEKGTDDARISRLMITSNVAPTPSKPKEFIDINIRREVKHSFFMLMLPSSRLPAQKDAESATSEHTADTFNALERPVAELPKKQLRGECIVYGDISDFGGEDETCTYVDSLGTLEKHLSNHPLFHSMTVPRVGFILRYTENYIVLVYPTKVDADVLSTLTLKDMSDFYVNRVVHGEYVTSPATSVSVEELLHRGKNSTLNLFYVGTDQ